jgi:hypothetical protein
MTTQACLHARSTTVPPPTAANTCRSGCDCCSFGHSGACPLDESSAASCHTSCHGPGPTWGGPGYTTQPRPRASMQASATPTRRPVPWTPSPSPAPLRWPCGVWTWSRRARPPPTPTLAEAVIVVARAMLVLGPMIGRGGCSLPHAQTHALMELYNATNGPSWGQRDSWMAGDPCIEGWYGVTCNLDMDDGVATVAYVGLPHNG